MLVLQILKQMNILELVNKDHVIAHVAPDGELEIEFFVEPGEDINLLNGLLVKHYKKMVEFILMLCFLRFVKLRLMLKKRVLVEKLIMIN